jgi:hypothetical protein
LHTIRAARSKGSDRPAATCGLPPATSVTIDAHITVASPPTAAVKANFDATVVGRHEARWVVV